MGGWGSVLGPTMLVIYFNDMPETVDSMYQLFADDAKVFRTAYNAPKPPVASGLHPYGCVCALFLTRNSIQKISTNIVIC